MFGLGGNSKGRSPIGIAQWAQEVYLAQRAPDGGFVFASQPLAEGTDPALPTYHTETSRAVASAMRRVKFAGKHSVSALPMVMLQSKTLRLPPMPEEDLVQAVAWEAAERFQIGEDQTIQHYSAGEVRQGNEIRQEVILLSAERATMYDHASAMKQAGLIPIAIDATGAALARLLGNEQGSTLIVDLSEGVAEIVGTRGKQVIFDKPVTLTQDADEIDAAALARELGLCLRYLSVTFGVHKPDAAWLCGRGANVNLAAKLSDALPVMIEPVAQAPALQGIHFPVNNPSPWLVPIGLALREQDAAERKGAA